MRHKNKNKKIRLLMFAIICLFLWLVATNVIATRQPVEHDGARPQSASSAEDSIQSAPPASAIDPCLLDTVVCEHENVQEYITTINNGRIDNQMLLDIAWCESRFNPAAKGDNGASRGLWQIHRPSHPNVSDECAFDVECSTEWTIDQILKGNLKKWTCAYVMGYLKK